MKSKIPDYLPDDVGDFEATVSTAKITHKRIGPDDFLVRRLKGIPRVLFGPRPGYPSTVVNKIALTSALDWLKDAGIASVFCLLSDAESLAYYGLYLEGQYNERGWTVRRYPILDFGVPRSDLFFDFISTLADAIYTHKHLVYVHCSAGQGRTGLTLECLREYLLLTGKQIPLIGLSGYHTIEQFNFIYRFRQHCQTRLKDK